MGITLLNLNPASSNNIRYSLLYVYSPANTATSVGPGTCLGKVHCPPAIPSLQPARSPFAHNVPAIFKNGDALLIIPVADNMI